MKILAIGMLAATLAFAATGKNAFDKATFEHYLRHIELFRGPVEFKIDDPKPSRYLPGFSEVLVHEIHNDVEQDQKFYISRDGKIIIKGDVYDIDKQPFQSNLDHLTLNDQPSFGPANAPVTIVEFGDFECPDCKMEAPILRHEMPEALGPKVRVVFKNYPLESIHPWALAGAIAGRCVFRQGNDAFWKFYDWIYTEQENISGDNLKAKVLEWAGQNGLDTAKLGQCIDTKATEPEVNASIAEARSLGVQGTPTLFINGRKIGGLVWPDLQLVIQNELDYQQGK